jgi:hypothetical protein
VEVVGDQRSARAVYSEVSQLMSVLGGTAASNPASEDLKNVVEGALTHAYVNLAGKKKEAQKLVHAAEVAGLASGFTDPRLEQTLGFVSDVNGTKRIITAKGARTAEEVADVLHATLMERFPNDAERNNYLRFTTLRLPDQVVDEDLAAAKDELGVSGCELARFSRGPWSEDARLWNRYYHADVGKTKTTTFSCYQVLQLIWRVSNIFQPHDKALAWLRRLVGDPGDQQVFHQPWELLEGRGLLRRSDASKAADVLHVTTEEFVDFAFYIVHGREAEARAAEARAARASRKEAAQAQESPGESPR